MTITSAANPRVKAVMKLRRSRSRRGAEVFLAEGVREVSRAVEAGLRVRELWVCPQLIGDAGWPSKSVYEVPAELLVKMTYHREPEGVLAVVEKPRWTLEGLKVSGSTRVLMAVGTEKPGNLGAMVRTACAAGFDAVIAAGSVVDVFNPNAIRSSTGGVFVMPTLVLGEDEAIAWVRSSGLRAVAATPAGSVDYRRADWSGPLALVIGPEDAGLSERWLALADETGGQRVALPNAGPLVDSLNASVAAGVLMYEAVRAGGK